MSKDVKEAEELLAEIGVERERRVNSTLACYDTNEDDDALSKAGAASAATRAGTTMQTFRTGGADVAAT